MEVMEKKRQEIEFNETKFKELLIYVASKCEHDIYFGATKLNKILFYSDFIFYYIHGKPITGAEYKALKRGPVPTILKRIRDEMHGKDIAIQKRVLQERIFSLRDPDLKDFTAEEIAIVDSVIEALREKDAETVSLMSHGLLGWKAAWAEGKAIGKHVTIPYDTIFVSNPPLDEFEKAHGLELVGTDGKSC